VPRRPCWPGAGAVDFVLAACRRCPAGTGLRAFVWRAAGPSSSRGGRRSVRSRASDGGSGRGAGGRPIGTWRWPGPPTRREGTSSAGVSSRTTSRALRPDRLPVFFSLWSPRVIDASALGGGTSCREHHLVDDLLDELRSVDRPADGPGLDVGCWRVRASLPGLQRRTSTGLLAVPRLDPDASSVAAETTVDGSPGRSLNAVPPRPDHGVLL